MPSCKGFQRAWAVEPRRGADEPELDRSLGGPRQRLSGLSGIRLCGDGRPRLLEEPLACRRELDAARLALQQLDAEFGLQLGDRL